MLAIDLEWAASQFELTHVQADLLDNRIPSQHVGTARPLVVDLIGSILVALGPSVDRRLELQAKGLDTIGGVEPEQPVMVR